MDVNAPPAEAALGSRRTFEEVVARIREQIAAGLLRVGDKLPAERDLASRFGVSRNTVREALRALENAGLVQLKKGAAGGAFIAGARGAVSVAFGDLFRLGTIRPADLTEARIVIGTEVARLACQRRDDADMVALEDNVRRTRDASEKGDLVRRANTNMEFHTLLARAARNPVLLFVTEALLDITRKYVHALGAMPNRFALESRDRMLVHLRARDSEAAAQEMRRYLQETQRFYLGKLDEMSGM